MRKQIGDNYDNEKGTPKRAKHHNKQKIDGSLTLGSITEGFPMSSDLCPHGALLR